MIFSLTVVDILSEVGFHNDTAKCGVDEHIQSQDGVQQNVMVLQYPQDDSFKNVFLLSPLSANRRPPLSLTCFLVECSTANRVAVPRGRNFARRRVGPTICLGSMFGADRRHKKKCGKATAQLCRPESARAIWWQRLR